MLIFIYKFDNTKTMNERYSRNRIYLSDEEQNLIKNYRILLGGAGVGSIIAECALRFGFENITIVDGDKVELSNLNRQNYLISDIGKYKAIALAERLLSINPEANIKTHTCFINESNVESLVNNQDAAINALDFTSEIPFVFDRKCKVHGIPVLHPYNFGWAGLVTVVSPETFQLEQYSNVVEGYELKLAEYVNAYLKLWNRESKKEWLDEIIEKYKKEGDTLPPPQLSIASWIVGGISVNLLYNLATAKEVKWFPKFYLSSVLCDNN